jgi:DNA-binding Lrp family transcriptional regulator
MVNLNQKDLLLLSFLRDNSREKLTTISRKTGIPISTIFDRLKDFNKKEIRKFSCIVDFSKLGFPIKTKILIKVNSHEREELEKYLNRNEKVNSLFKINNGYNFLIEGIFKSLKESENFVEKLEKRYVIENIQSFYVLNEIKRESFNFLHNNKVIIKNSGFL